MHPTWLYVNCLLILLIHFDDAFLAVTLISRLLLCYRDGRLQEGDQILAIDGQPLDSNISHQQAISILQQARGLVELVVARGGITAPDHQGTTTATAAVSLERSPSAVSDTSKGSDMVVSKPNWAILHWILKILLIVQYVTILDC